MGDWLGPILGAILIRVAIGGAVLTGMKFLWEGLLLFAAFILVPLVIFLVWEAWNVMGPNDPNIEEPF